MNLQNIMSNVIDQFGNEITVNNKITSYDEVYGDENSTSSVRTTTAAMNSITGTEEWNKSGFFSSKDKIFFIKGSEDISIRDEIIIDGEKYEVAEEPIAHKIGNTIQHFECRSKYIGNI